MDNVIQFPGARKPKNEIPTRQDTRTEVNRIVPLEDSHEAMLGTLLDRYTSDEVLERARYLNSILRTGNYSKEVFKRHWNLFARMNDNELLDYFLSINIDEWKGKPAYLAALNKSIATRGSRIIAIAKQEVS